MKICLISFDHWGFDKHIITALQQRGVEANHINLSNFKYKYPTFMHRITNGLNKLVLKKNIKKLKRQEYVLNELKAIGKQDSILVIRPDLLDLKTHLAIKQATHNYKAYLYDCTARFPIDHLLDDVFDSVASFDENDVKKYNLLHLSNYIYLPKKETACPTTLKHNVFMVISKDERLPVLNTIANKLDTINIDYKFIVKTSKRPDNLNLKIETSKTEIRINELIKYLDESEIFLDIVRKGHNGLSFRIFESLAYQKKLITTNQSIKNYDFYDPNNILIIDEDNVSIDSEFFNKPYIPLSEEVYNKYTIDNWIDSVFFN